eukprot:CAMPEP_0184485582 /NCGR_PEP_ID=MMETSP0113_2-20130426/7168_1 /TAXON_ID=91329 /ORGANISM="Norrisiella sphaerica, Strain BC52" /LENGTH=583 /DNA_ID=CAMNT_0026867089 /DNA_START=76 /DNA_END=1827 /DNA_ORIENTATION=+
MSKIFVRERTRENLSDIESRAESVNSNDTGLLFHEHVGLKGTAAWTETARKKSSEDAWDWKGFLDSFPEARQGATPDPIKRTGNSSPNASTRMSSVESHQAARHITPTYIKVATPECYFGDVEARDRSHPRYRPPVVDSSHVPSLYRFSQNKPIKALQSPEGKAVVKEKEAIFRPNPVHDDTRLSPPHRQRKTSSQNPLQHPPVPLVPLNSHSSLFSSGSGLMSIPEAPRVQLTNPPRLNLIDSTESANIPKVPKVPSEVLNRGHEKEMREGRSRDFDDSSHLIVPSGSNSPSPRARKGNPSLHDLHNAQHHSSPPNGSLSPPVPQNSATDLFELVTTTMEPISQMVRASRDLRGDLDIHKHHLSGTHNESKATRVKHAMMSDESDSRLFTKSGSQGQMSHDDLSPPLLEPNQFRALFGEQLKAKPEPVPPLVPAPVQSAHTGGMMDFGGGATVELNGNGKPRLLCHLCGKSFSTAASRSRHMRIHNDERPYECQFCSKRFRQNAHLKKHIRLHTGEKPHQCPFCPKRFTQKSTLTGHVRTKHTKECPINCPNCTAKFPTRNHLRAHKSKCTGAIGFGIPPMS